MAEKSIHHFLFLKLSSAYWALPEQEKRSFFPAFSQDLSRAAECINFYQVSPIQAGIDLLVWSAAHLEQDSDEAGFFEGLARASHLRRQYLEPVASLWGYTQPSVYTRAPSNQEVDVFAEPRQNYLVLYPFVKTIEWYLLGKDTRQGMMNEHIRIGHQYPQIQQLLLYSFGVQDQEFIVVYETPNLYQFSELVHELRGSDVRTYTERDTPVYTGIWRSPEALADLYGASR